MATVTQKTDREQFESDLTEALLDLLSAEVKAMPWSKFDGRKRKADVCPESNIPEARVDDAGGEVIYRSGRIDLSARDWNYKVSYELDRIEGRELVYRLSWS